MTIKLGVVMDPIAAISYKKDTTMAMLWAAQDRGWELYYMEQTDLYLEQGLGRGRMARLTVFRDPDNWFQLDEPRDSDLAGLDVILMRKDPPFDNEYIYSTYILEEAERRGSLIVNRCQSLRDCNEKVFATQFPQCCPPVLVSADMARLKAFHQHHQDVGGAHVAEVGQVAEVVGDRLSDEGELNLRLGNAHLNLGQYGECVSAIQDGIKKGGIKSADNAQISLGMCLYNQKKYRDAITAFREAGKTTRSRNISRQWIGVIESDINRNEQIRLAEAAAQKQQRELADRRRAREI